MGTASNSPSQVAVREHGRRRRATSRRRPVTAARAVCAVLMVSLLWCCSSALADSGGAGIGGSPASSGSAVFARTLRRGENGADVKKLQRWLAELGYNVSVSGHFGWATKTAVRKFQKSHGLRPPSGTVGSRTAAAIAAAIRKLGSSGGTRPIDPIPGFTIGRDDMGVDGSASAGAPIYAPLPSKLVQVLNDWYAGEPLLLFKFQHRPAGAPCDYWYVAEQIDPVTTRIGTRFHTRQVVATFASSGTGIEIGWGSPTAWTRTLAGVSDPGAASPPSGSKTRWGESFKRFFGIP
jgi:peptidoglycan hydrolase-like protein with peptidoglycan-binding domain